MKSLITWFILLLFFADKRKPGNPLDNLPKNIEILTHFGERADFSPVNFRGALKIVFDTG